MPILYSSVQYSGIWTMQQVNSAISAGTWIGPALYAWGYNNNGQTGLGNRTATSSPNQVGTLKNWATVSAHGGSGLFSFATKTDGTLWGWGQNNNGQLGLNNTTDYSSPKQVGSLTTWLKVAAGYSSTFGIKTDGTLWS